MNAFPFPFSWLAESALSGSAAIVLILVLRPFVRRWLGARALHFLWLIVLLRLLIPWTPHTPLAILPARAKSETPTTTVIVRSYVLAGQAEQNIVSFTPAPATPAKVDLRLIPERIARPAAFLWMFGVAVVFGFSLASSMRTRPLIRRACEIVPDSPAMRVLAALPVSVRHLRILETNELKSPALCGFLRPIVLLPPGWADTLAPAELRCILLHEIGHHRRGDVLWRWAFLVARAVYWFNPLVWLAEREMRVDQEMACDEWVLAHGTGIDSETYGEVLLRACRNLTVLRITSPGHATMAESSAGLAKRIRHIARVKPHGWPALVGVGALAALLCVVGPSSGDAQNPVQAPIDPATTPVSPAPPAAPAAEPSPEPVAPSLVSAPAVPPGTSPVVKPKGQETQIEIAAKFIECPKTASQDVSSLFLLDAAVTAKSHAPSAPIHAPSILEDSQFQVLIRGLNRIKGVDMLSAPRVTTKSGQKAVVEVIREFRYPTEYTVADDGSGRAIPSAFETRNIGVTLEVLPTVGAGGQIDLALSPSQVQFVGFVNYGADMKPRKTLTGDALSELMKNQPTRLIKTPAVTTPAIINQPVFETRKISTQALLKSGQTVVVGGLSRRETQTVEEWSTRHSDSGKRVRTKKTWEEQIDKYLYIFVSVRILNPENVAPAANSPAQAPE